MDRAPFPDSFSAEQQLFINQAIFDEALGNPIIISADPTTSVGQLQVNQVGFNPATTGLFINLNGSTYKIATLTLV